MICPRCDAPATYPCYRGSGRNGQTILGCLGCGARFPEPAEGQWVSPALITELPDLDREIIRLSIVTKHLGEDSDGGEVCLACPLPEGCYHDFPNLSKKRARYKAMCPLLLGGFKLIEERD